MVLTDFLLDTSAYSAYAAGNEAVALRVDRADHLVISTIVLGELRAGFASGSRKKQNEGELRSFLSSSRTRIVNIDEETAAAYASIHRELRLLGKPIPTNDIWIAASSLQHRLVLLTRDTHFLQVSSIVIDLV